MTIWFITNDVWSQWDILPETELKCVIHCPELVPPPPPNVVARLAEEAVQNTYYTPGRQEAEHLERLAGRVAGPGLGAGLAEGLGAAAGVPVAGLPPFLRRPASVPGGRGERPEGLLKVSRVERRLRDQHDSVFAHVHIT